MRQRLQTKGVNGTASATDAEVLTKEQPSEVEAITARTARLAEETEQMNAPEVEEKAAIIHPASVEISKVRTVNDRLNALEELSALKERYERIHSKFQDLKILKAGNDQQSAEVKVSAGGKEIRLHNTATIAQVLSVLDRNLSEALQITESEILQLEV